MARFGALASTVGPRRAAVIVLGVYLGWVAAFFGSGRHATQAVNIGAFVRSSERSAAIDAFRGRANEDHRNRLGYDGQCFFYLALDPAQAWHYMDAPRYRYDRPLYPLLARAVSLGQRSAVAYALLAINVLAAVLGAWALASLLARRGEPPECALLYG